MIWTMGREIRCCFCRTDQHGLPNTWLGPNHHGIREDIFGAERAIRGRGRTKIILDGVDVTLRCIEAYAGRETGWVALYVYDDRNHRIVCQFGKDHGLAEIVHGDVRVEILASGYRAS